MTPTCPCDPCQCAPVCACAAPTGCTCGPNCQCADCDCQKA